MAHLVIPDNPEGYMTKKASISNIAGESIPLMFGVLPRDNFVSVAWYGRCYSLTVVHNFRVLVGFKRHRGRGIS